MFKQTSLCCSVKKIIYYESQMKISTPITTLFLDIGGIILTNGWDRHARERAAKKFNLDLPQMESRHNATFDTLEIGKLSLSEYMKRVVFYSRRSFTEEEFKKFMFLQSQSFPQMIDLIKKVKEKNKLKIVAVSNESKELNEYRIKKFALSSIIDCFVSSCYVRVRKPDFDIYRIALDISQKKPSEVLYIDDRLMFVQVAKSLKIHGLHHTDFESTCKKLLQLSLKV